MKNIPAGKIRAGKLVESVLNAYDPDSEFRAKHVRAPVGSFLEAVKAGRAEIASVRIIEANIFGMTRVRRITSTVEFKAAIEKAEKHRKALDYMVESGVKLREADKFTDDEKNTLQKIAESDFATSDPDNTSGFPTNPFQEYIPLLGGPFSHQLYLFDMLDALAKSFEAWNHNPLAHQIIKLTTHFVLGRGVTFKAMDETVQEEFREWWDKNEMNSRLEFWSDMLSRDGELMIRTFRNKITGEMFLRWVDPSTIWEIVTDIEDIERVFYYHQQYPTAYQVLYGTGAGNAKFDPTKFESSKYVINQIPADEIYHVKINCSPNEKRGRSDLFSVLGWLKRYKDFLTSVVLRSIMQGTFAWKNKLKGNDSDVQAFINAFGTKQPNFGEIWVENESSTLEPMSVDMQGQGLADAPGIVNMISVGAGIPKESLGISEHSTRATAVVASEPGVKKYHARQLLLGRLLKDIAQDWFDNEIVSGRIPAQQPATEDDDLPVVLRWIKKNASRIPGVGRLLNLVTGGTVMEPTDGTIEFQFPEIAVEDRTAKLKDIEMAQQAGYISKKRAGTMTGKELGIEDYDYDKEQEEIAEETQNDVNALFTTSPQAPGSDGEPKKPSGSLSGQERSDIKNQNR